MATKQRAALLYYERYRPEIDAEIAENAALTFWVVKKRFPDLARRA